MCEVGFHHLPVLHVVKGCHVNGTTYCPSKISRLHLSLPGHETRLSLTSVLVIKMWSDNTV